MTVVGFYNSIKEIGNHEKYLEKVGIFSAVLTPMVITFVEENSNASVYNGEQFIPAHEGMIIGENALVKSNDGAVQIESVKGEQYRLTAHSEFCLEMTICGVVPVFYGDVHVNTPHHDSFYNGAGKYRTSCWIQPTGETQRYTVMRLNSSEDIYYAESEPITIVEYDENGKQFEIVTVPAYHKCVLSFDITKPMREKYSVQSIMEMDTSDMKMIFENYLKNSKWLNEMSVSAKAVN